MSTFLGRWPLIPDNYCDVRLPKNNLQTITAHPYHLTPFTDRLLHIHTTRVMTAIMVPPSWKTDKTCPESVLRHAKHFQESIQDCMPPAFNLKTPDMTWDAALPSIAQKREHLKANIYALFASLHRSFINPYSDKLIKSTAQLELAASHQITLASACSDTITSLIRLHNIMGGGDRQAFFIPMTLIETSAVLGMCLLSMRRPVKGAQYYSAAGEAHWDLDMQQRLYNSFHKALALLSTLTERSKIAQKGVRVLQSLKRKVESRIAAENDSRASHVNREFPAPLPIPDEATLDDEWLGCASPPLVPESTSNQENDFETNNLAGFPNDGAEYMESEWAAFACSPDQSWFFSDDLFSVGIESPRVIN